VLIDRPVLGEPRPLVRGALRDAHFLFRPAKLLPLTFDLLGVLHVLRRLFLPIAVRIRSLVSPGASDPAVPLVPASALVLVPASALLPVGGVGQGAAGDAAFQVQEHLRVPSYTKIRVKSEDRQATHPFANCLRATCIHKATDDPADCQTARGPTPSSANVGDGSRLTGRSTPHWGIGNSYGKRGSRASIPPCSRRRSLLERQ
jgi:hypothetical protein